ncbi:hypothetical protein EDB92DRAFT_1875031 [Lactarius akahatsu]|uniref:Uncharacterized protein n=1 Tax=Lactarius akahatsu TaxID=416441 RepID=A0AAD4QBU1_9AGAM|nr:hypothetical protein EDB92DRAFT_1875031 [Lactarius akahatsu]
MALFWDQPPILDASARTTKLCRRSGTSVPDGFRRRAPRRFGRYGSKAVGMQFTSLRCLEKAKTTRMRNEDRSFFHTTSTPSSSKSYKVLSSDPGGQTTFLLGHISQQLAIFALNHTSIPPKQYAAYPSLSIIRVRLVWPRRLALSTLRWTRH